MRQEMDRQEERARVMRALARQEADETLTRQEIESIVEQEIAKPDKLVDIELIDACCVLLCTVYGRDDLCANTSPKLPSGIITRARHGAASGTIRFALRSAAVALCMIVVFMAADISFSRRMVDIRQSEDQSQALVGFDEREKTLPHAEANDPEELRVKYVASSLRDLWHHTGYTLPLPQWMPQEMHAVQAFTIPAESADIVVVLYEGKDSASVKVKYYYDASREKVLLGYERWNDPQKETFENGNVALRFPETEQTKGVRSAVFVVPHMTCVVEAKEVEEADFIKILASMDKMEAGGVPENGGDLPDEALDMQREIKEDGTLMLYYYTMEDMQDCTHTQAPFPTYIPQELELEYGVYIKSSFLRRIDARFSTHADEGEENGERHLHYDYDFYEDVDFGMQISVEQDGEGKYVPLSNGRQAYIAYNAGRMFGIVTGERLMINISVEGYGEDTLMKIINSLPAFS